MKAKSIIFLSDSNTVLEYTSDSSFVSNNYPIRNNRQEHANYIAEKLTKCNQSQKAFGIRRRDGIYLEFSGLENYSLNTKSLENMKQGIRLLKVWKDNEIERAIVYIPNGKESYFLNKVKDSIHLLHSSSFSVS